MSYACRVGRPAVWTRNPARARMHERSRVVVTSTNVVASSAGVCRAQRLAIRRSQPDALLSYATSTSATTNSSPAMAAPVSREHGALSVFPARNRGEPVGSCFSGLR
jgi:hypothetical protein